MQDRALPDLAEQAGWQAVAISADLPAGTAHPVILNGMELALWRDEDGNPHCWRDHCPHRGMRLSFGFVRGNRLTCLYHGWQFGKDGGCKHIPAHPDLDPPETLQTRAYAAVETGGMIFVASAGRDDPPRIEGDWHPVRTVFLPCALEDAAKAVAESDLGIERIDPHGGLARSEDGQVSVFLQHHTETHTALHMTSLNPTPDARKALAQALVALRRSVPKRGEP